MMALCRRLGMTSAARLLGTSIETIDVCVLTGGGRLRPSTVARIRTALGKAVLTHEVLMHEVLVSLPLSEMRVAMRELEEIERDWSSAEDEHAAKVSMSTVRRCVALLRAAESVSVLSGGKSESLHTATGGDLEMIGHQFGIARRVAMTGSVQTYEPDHELRTRIIIAMSPLSVQAYEPL